MTTHDKPQTPYELAHTLFSACRHELEQRTIRVRGEYRSRENSFRGSYYYDRLRDERKECLLVIKVPKILRPQLIDRTTYELEGRIEKGLIRSEELGIHLYFTVVDVVGRKDPIIDPRIQEKADILQSHLSKRGQDVDLLLRNLFEAKKRPVIAMVFGRGAATEADIMWAVGNRQGRYEFAKFPINLSDKKAIIDKLRDLDKPPGYDLVALYRGGGSGLEIFDDLDIARVVVGMKTPFVTAIGHAMDVPFMQQVADRAFTTPTDFGRFLKEAADRHAKEVFQANRHHEQEAKYRREIKSLRDENDNLHDEILRMSHVQQEQIPAQIASTFRRLSVWLLAAALCGAVIGAAGSYICVVLLSKATPAATNIGSSIPNEQTSPDPASTPANANSQNAGKKRHGGR